MAVLMWHCALCCGTAQCDAAALCIVLQWHFRCSVLQLRLSNRRDVGTSLFKGMIGTFGKF